MSNQVNEMIQEQILDDVLNLYKGDVWNVIRAIENEFGFDELRFINDDDEYAIKVLDKNGGELIAIGIGNPFFATYEHIGYEDRKYMGGPVSSADIEIAIPLEFKPAVFIISKRDNVGKFNDLQEILVP